MKEAENIIDKFGLTLFKLIASNIIPMCVLSTSLDKEPKEVWRYFHPKTRIRLSTTADDEVFTVKVIPYDGVCTKKDQLSIHDQVIAAYEKGEK